MFLAQFVTIIYRLVLFSIFSQLSQFLTHSCNNKFNMRDISNRKYRQSSRNSSTMRFASVPHTCQRYRYSCIQKRVNDFCIRRPRFPDRFRFHGQFHRNYIVSRKWWWTWLLRIFGNSVDNSLVDKKGNKKRFNAIIRVR